MSTSRKTGNTKALLSPNAKTLWNSLKRLTTLLAQKSMGSWWFYSEQGLGCIRFPGPFAGTRAEWTKRRARELGPRPLGAEKWPEMWESLFRPCERRVSHPIAQFAATCRTFLRLSSWRFMADFVVAEQRTVLKTLGNWELGSMAKPLLLPCQPKPDRRLTPESVCMRKFLKSGLF
ncbi:uncharacterized protein UV8b_08021 [Ustilaginoidea virens]|uniref:Uncharacterized protein n=1 Tax=Ustilaginoidea virens TaxID=1159556 RepID=A0A8E5HY42_USTVR|nr:uncharacterized protein UV8b_08021 [Ustilaginoidea virens]QUC23780.1 hypothetical protein UV8b_08021 [Ustilaginoidea virens]